MIYLDNGATTFPKPECVYEAMDHFARTAAVNAGRGAYKAAREAFNPSPLAVGFKPEKPATVPLDSATDALVWSSEGDIHIEIRKK